MTYKNVKSFLSEIKDSKKQFNRLMEFFEFKEKIAHKQNFEDACKAIAVFFRENFYVTSMKVTSYDIEHSFEKELYIYGENFNESFEKGIIKFDFSKSYSLNGRVYWKVVDENRYEEVLKDKVFLDFILYEIKHILINYLAIVQLKQNTYMDDITLLPNRRFLVKHLSSLLEVAKKENIKIALLKVDIDRFKSVLEEFNYEVSNKVLNKLSNVLQQNISNTDIVTKFEINSFMICMQDLKDECEASVLAKNCIDQFSKEFVIVDENTKQKLFKTISIGIVIYPNDGETLDVLFKNSDIALDEAKNKGRSSFEFFQKEQNCSIDLF